MLHIEIAGRRIVYRNVGELNTKLVTLLDDIHQKRVATGQAYETLRKNEESIRRLLGGCAEGDDNGVLPGKASNAA